MYKSVAVNNETSFEVPQTEKFSLWVETVIEEFNRFFQVDIEIVDSEASQDLNRTYRGKDQPTNVLSFPLELPDYVEEDLIGDLVICAEIVAKEAKEQNKPEEHHWAHLTIHGCLHLLGYDHINDEDAEEMEALEIKLLDKLDIPNPYD